MPRAIKTCLKLFLHYCPQVECNVFFSPHTSKETVVRTGARQGHSVRGSQVTRSRIHTRSILTRLAANIVMVKKVNGKWRMCVNFTDLNKACPKDSYPLPRFDILVDSTARHQLLSFIGAFSGYNQIKLAKTDQEKTSFVTNQGLFCYKVMPFELKNVGATYQRLMNKMFTH